MAQKPPKSEGEKPKAPKLLTQEQLFATMNKTYGKDSIATLDMNDSGEITHWSSTGNYGLDDAMNWGLPGGRVVEWFGAESSGKTTQLMKALIENARRGGYNAVFDPEGTFNRDRYMEMGGDPTKLIIIDPGTAEQFYDKVQLVIAWANSLKVPSNAVVLIALDTMAMLIPKRVLEADGGDELVAELPRINSRNLPKIHDSLPAHCCFLILNQVRDKIGSMAWGAADENIDTPGGHIVKHAASIRVFFKKTSQVDNGKTGGDRVIVGMNIDYKVVKCKVGAPLRRGSFRIMFDKRGVDNVHALLLRCVDQKLIAKTKGGVYIMKSGGQEVSFKSDEFAGVLQARPKLLTGLLDRVYELAQPGIDLSGHLQK